MSKVDILKIAKPGATFLLNAPYKAEEVWDHLPIEVQEEIISKKLNFYTINAVEVARETGMGQRINTVMQTCFFAISNILPKDEAIAQIKNAIKKTYSKKATPLFRKTSRLLTLRWNICTRSNIRLPLPPNSTVSFRFRPMLRNLSERLPAKSSPTAATSFRFLLLNRLSTAPGRPARPNTKNAALPPKFRFGIRIPVFSAANARWSARMALSA